MNKLLAFALLAAGCAGAPATPAPPAASPPERNALRHYAEVEEFLARCLGGRTSRPDR